MSTPTKKRKAEEGALVSSRTKRRKAFRTHRAKGLLPAPLPNEVVCLIFDQIRRPDDALRFMLSCKRVYNVGRGYMAYWERFWRKVVFDRIPNPLAYHRSCPCPEYKQIWKEAQATGRTRCLHYSMFQYTHVWGEFHCNEERHYTQKIEVPTKAIPPADVFNDLSRRLNKDHVKRRNVRNAHLKRQLAEWEIQVTEARTKLTYWTSQAAAVSSSLHNAITELVDHQTRVEEGVSFAIIPVLD